MVFLKANIPLAKVRILFHITKNKLFFRFLLQNAFCYKTLSVINPNGELLIEAARHLIYKYFQNVSS